MKLSNFGLLVGLIVMGSWVASCSSNPSTPQSGSGTLSGTVIAYGVSGPTLVNPSGITVSLEGSAYKTTTDNAGNFSLGNIPAGVYNIIFSKVGFDSMMYPSHHLLGTGVDIINDAYLIEESNDSIVIDKITVLGIDSNSHIDTLPYSITVTGHLAGNDSPVLIQSQLFLDTLASSTPIASAADYPSAKNTFNLWMGGQGFYGNVRSGTVLYIKAVVVSNTTGLGNGTYHEYFSQSTTPATKPVRMRFVVP
jgi:hypothetical protein